MNDIERLVALNMVEDIGSVRTRALLSEFGSFEKVFKAGADEIGRVKEIGPVIGARVPQAIKEVDLKKEIGLIKKHGVKVVTFLDKDYPENLKTIYDPPVVLYVKGRILPDDKLAIAIVGSRLASFYGLQTAEKLGFELASHGLTVVSGLARGIDSASHKGALKAKGRTLAILGSGLANIYPEENIRLAEKISESGAVISEFPMATIPDRGNFPKRNRIISGISLGVVCVEAAEKSGALITCDCALEQGRDVFAVPGKVDSMTSKGTNKLIKQGAKLAQGIEDILEELDLETLNRSPNGKVQTLLLDKNENLVYTLLSSDPRYIDDICRESGIGLNRIAGILLNLEIKKFAKQLPGKNFVKI
ncbi:MAG: DNA-protecting protein DprA [Candidatus Omnitrophica bacterium CG_4_9_14_0_2_um_filter_42_8]|nr:MAG: DNA-protecting protein DprA [Candidatus Omnitrophica bacterium CG_4_9_14_0_2_um_filter_42_8]